MIEYATHEGDHSTEPGAEVVDLDDQLGMTAKEARSYLDAAPEEITTDLAKLSGGFASDYEFATWLVDVLDSAGCSVIAYPSWQMRGRPRSTGPFTPRGVIWHHDASPKGPSPAEAKFIAAIGRPDEGIPAPLAQLWVCEGCDGAHPVGSWHVLAAGRANHAGLGDGWGSIPADLGNSVTLGVETDHTTGEGWPTTMYDSLVVGTAALLEHMRSDPDKWLCGHKEYAPGRKVDPSGLDMDQARVDVTEQIRKDTNATKLAPFPGRHHFELGHEDPAVEQLERWLLKLPGNEKLKHEPAETFTRWTKGRVAKFQESEPALRGDADGYPGPKTWRLLQLAARSS